MPCKNSYGSRPKSICHGAQFGFKTHDTDEDHIRPYTYDGNNKWSSSNLFIGLNYVKQHNILSMKY